jgi:hypothetical protein
MNRLYVSLLFIIIFIQTGSAQFNVIETPSQRLLSYGEASSYMVKYVGSCVENALGFQRRFYGYTPSEKVSVVMHDMNDYGNAGANTIPRNFVMIAIAPSNFVYETSPANERINTTMNHEFVHIATLDQSSSTDRFYRTLFAGKVVEESANPLTMIYSYMTTPRRASPRWYREGIAVFLETWMAGGIGRALGGYDEMVFRTFVKDDAVIYDLLGLESEGMQTDFQVEVNAYLYGTRFMSYMALNYGPEKLVKWTGRSEESYAYFASQFKNVYRISLTEAWLQWIEWEREFQKKNLDKINKHPVTQMRQVSPDVLGSLSRPFYDKENNCVYAAVNYPGQTAHVACLDLSTGRISKISDIKGPALYFVSSLAYDPVNRKIFYTSDNNDWRDLLELDIKTGKSKVLIEEARTGDLAFNRADNSLWGVRNYNGITTIVRIPYPYNDWNQVFSLPYGKIIYDIDISNDGKTLIGSLAEINGTQLLITASTDSLLSANHQYETIFNFENSLPANFVFSDDDKYLYGSSYYSGVSNVFRYSIENKDMEILSNVETGVFRPIPVSSDSLLAFKYTAKGLTAVMMENKPLQNVAAISFLGQEIVDNHPVVMNWSAPPPSSINFDSLTYFNGEYSPFSGIGFASIYPIVQGYKEFVAYGIKMNLSDPVGFQNFGLTASYSPNNLLQENEKLHLGLEYSYLNWEGTATLNNADFYDLFGPTKSSRKGYSFGLKYKQNIIYDNPEIMDYLVYANYYGNLERLPDYQNVAASYDRFFNFGSSFNHKDTRASLGAVDSEKGFKLQVNLNNNYVIRTLYPQLRANFDYGFALPINHSSIWLRSFAGYSYAGRYSEKRSDPFANFFFGGFGNNYVDNLNERRYREFHSFPGVELNSIGGTNFGKFIIDWNLPPIRFGNLGISSFFLNYARLSLFTSAIATDIDSRELRRSLANAGAQIDFKFVLFYHLKMTFSAGYAAAFEKDQKYSDELMFSLKVF